MKKATLLGIALIFYFTVNGQLIENYGLKLGAGLSNQHWKYKMAMFSNLPDWKENKLGIIGQVYAEKNFGKYISIRPAIGYIQKGFVEDVTLTIGEDERISVKNNKVAFHDLSLDLPIKIMPVDKLLKPYLFMGLRADYLLDYRNVIVNFHGEDIELDPHLYDDFNKFTLGAIIGLGCSYNNLFFLDLEYNPAIIKNYDSNAIAVNGRYFSLTIGLNINQL